MITDRELLELIVQQIDEVDLVDYLGLTTKDLTYAFEDEILNKRNLFLTMVETEDGNFFN